MPMHQVKPSGTVKPDIIVQSRNFALAKQKASGEEEK